MHHDDISSRAGFMEIMSPIDNVCPVHISFFHDKSETNQSPFLV